MFKVRSLCMVMLGLVIAFALVGCDEVPTQGSGGGADPAAAEPKEEAPKPLDLAIGKPADYKDFVVTVTKASKGPKDWEGKASFQVDVTYENKGEEAVSYNEFDWSIEDANGARIQDTAMIDGKDSLGSGEVAPGGSVKGTIYFAPKADTVKVVFAPSFFADEENLATWKVK